MKKWVKFSLWFFMAILAVALAGLGYAYYDNWPKSPPDKEKYPNYIGYINQDAALLNDLYGLCEDKRIYYVYNGASYRAYSTNKGYFKKNILKKYTAKGYNDSGYLNFRFLVNCEGNPGWFEIIQTDLNLEKTELNTDMVAQLLQLTADPSHWNTLYVEENPIDYYMYVSYRIENGAIVEILP